MLAPTLSGMADDGPCEDVRLSTHIDEVAALVQRSDLRVVSLVGHSYGGLIITGVGARIADRMARLVYLDAFVGEGGRSFAEIAPILDVRALVVDSRVPPMIPLHKLGDFDPGTAKVVGARLRGQPWRTFSDRLQFEASRLAGIPHAYVQTSDLIPEQAARAAAMGFEMSDHRPAGHDAMMTAPDLIAYRLETVNGLLVDRVEA